MSLQRLATKFILLAALCVGAVLMMMPMQVVAQPSPTINYQGKLTDSTGVAVADGTYNMRFWLLQSTSQATTSAVWTESLTSTNQVQVTNGLFSVMLGSTSALTSVDFNQELYLGVEIGGTGGTPSWDGEMSPRKPLGTVPAAFESFKLGGVASSSFLRSDQADSMDAFLTLTSGASTSDLIVSGTATTTNLVINNQLFSSLTGSGLTVSGGALTASISEAELNITGSPTNGYVLQASSTATGGFIWQATSSLGLTEDLSDNFISDLSDVDTSGASAGDLLSFSGGSWVDVSTSSLGLGDGTFLGLSDTPGSFTTSAIPYVSGSSLAFDSTFVYDGTNLGLGTASPGAMLDIFGTSNALRLSYDGSNYTELTVDSGGQLSISSSNGGASNIELGSGIAEDLALLFNGNGTDWYAGLDDTDDLFKIGTGSEMGTSTLFQISSATTTFNTAIVASTTATSTFTNGIELSGGCFRTAAGDCLGASGDTVVVVAANDSPANEKAFADYVADGTNDEDEIQQAIDYVYTNGGGGTVYLLAGTFTVGTTTYTDRAIDLATSTELVGQGDSTIIKLQDNFNANISVIYTTGDVKDVRIAHLAVDGNKVNQTAAAYYGINLNSGSSTIESVYVHDVQDVGIRFDDYSVLVNSIVDNSGSNGVTLGQYASVQGNVMKNNGGAGISSSNFGNISNNIVINNSNTGISVSGQGNTVDGNVVRDNTGDGITVTSSSNTISNNFVYNNSDGIYVFSGGGSVISDNTITYNLMQGLNLSLNSDLTVSGNVITNSTRVGIVADTITNSIFTGNTINSNGWQGISMYDNSHNNSVSGNTIIDNGYQGISLNTSNNNTVTGNSISLNSTGGVYASIYLTAADDNLISSNNITGAGTDPLIDIANSTSERNQITGNVYENADTTTYVTDAGTDTRYNEWDRTTITTDSERGYNLLSITGSTTATATAITQLGTGDIFTLNNASGRVLTVLNNGNVGIGTTSPSGVLSIAGDFFYASTSATSTFTSAVKATCFTTDGSTCLTGGGGAFTSSGGYTYLNTSSDLVGVGTSSPYAKLTVWGDTDQTGADIFAVVNNASSTMFRVTDSGSVYASNYMTSGGVSLGAGYTREGLWNASLAGLSGMYGLTTNQTNLREVVASTVFESANSDHISSDVLANGDVVMAYQDAGNGQYGTFAIHDQNGNQVVTPTVFESAITTHISVAALTDGNFIIGYQDSGNSSYGTFVIYDSAGNLVAGPTVFTESSTEQVSITTLTNGNVFIVYRDNGASQVGTFVIYDPAGNLVTGPTVFENANSMYVEATTLKNGNVFIAYRDNGNSSYGTFVIYDPAGNLVAGPTVFESAAVWEVAVTPLMDGGVLVAYADSGNTDYGTFTIYDSAGNQLVAPTVFESAGSYSISAATLPNENVIISYKDSGNTNAGTLIVYDPAGNLVAGPTVFDVGATSLTSANALMNGNALIAYQDGNNGSYGTFVIYGAAGTEFTSNLAVTTDTTQSYNLLSITGSTTATATAITQLGTGDIFTLNNASGRVLTVLNNGNVGIGTTSPSGVLSIAGDFFYASTSATSTFTSAVKATCFTTDGSTCLTGGGGAFTSSGGYTYLNTSSDLVGVGTSTPNARLTVVGAEGSSNALFRVASSSNFSTGTIDGAWLAVDETGLTKIAGKVFNPTKVGGAEAGNSAYGIAVQGDYAYVTNLSTATHELEIFDVSDPINPTKVGGAAAASHALDVAVSGDYAYVVSDVTGDDLEIFDVSDPTTPVKVGGVGAASTVYDIELSGQYAYLASHNAGGDDDLEIFDISDPTNPVKVGGVAAADDAYGVAVQGGYAYVVSDVLGNDFEVFDVSDPTSPIKVGGVGATNVANAVVVSGSYAYVGTDGTFGSNGLDVFDISDPAAPVKVATADAASSVNDLTVAGRYLYVSTNANAGDELEVFDISSSTNPIKIAGVGTADDAEGVVVAGNYAYVVSQLNNDDLEIFDIGGVEISNTEIGSAKIDSLRVSQTSIFDQSVNIGTGLNVGQNALVGGALTITGNASSTLTTNLAQLVLGGNTARDSYLSFKSGTDKVWSMGLDQTGSAFRISSSSALGTNDYFSILAGGNVGIGTSSPYAKLSVVGDVVASSFNATSTTGYQIGGDTILTRDESTYSLALGQDALGTTLSSQNYNIGIGYQVARTLEGQSNIGVGWQALNRVGSGQNNVSIGHQSTYWFNAATNTTAIGYQAGYGAPGSAISSENNSLFGYRSGYGLVSGSNNLLLGYQVGDSLSTGSNNILIGYDIDAPSNTGDNQLSVGNLIFGTGVDGTGTTLSSGNIGIGTSSPSARLSIDKSGVSGAGVVGLDQYLQTENSVDAAVQYGNRFYLNASNTATTTLVGSMYRIKDSTEYGNTVRGLEVQTNKGINTEGENTALSGFARTFGVRGYTSGDAGGTYEPAGGFFETGGTTQGNAMRGYSGSITTATLLSLFQDTSTFTGTGLEMNFGNTTGSFSSTTSKYLDFQNGGTSVFTVSAYGTTTIGDGTTNNMAGLQIGYGGICVDNDGSCVASTTGQVAAVSYYTGNSDLAEMYFSSTELESGEVVTLSGGLSIDRAEKESDTPVLGVVSTKPGMTLGYDDESLQEGEKAFPVALTGRVPVKLSTENGPIKKGDQLMLSSLPGVAMKASGTGVTIGIALEDFDEARMYSDTYINQFGDDMVEPVFEPIEQNDDPRIDDGCYYGGGNAAGEEPCVPLVGTTTDEQIAEANELAEQESIEEQLEELQKESSDTEYLADGSEVKVGQVVMFVERGYRWVDDTQLAALGVLMSTSSIETIGDNEDETLFDRLVILANSFVDGVLSVFELKVERVEVANELCVDGVCVNADDLRAMLADTEAVSSLGGGVSEEDVHEEESDLSTENDNNNPSEAPVSDDSASSSDETASSTDESVVVATSTEETAGAGEGNEMSSDSESSEEGSEVVGEEETGSEGVVTTDESQESEEGGVGVSGEGTEEGVEETPAEESETTELSEQEVEDDSLTEPAADEVVVEDEVPSGEGVVESNN